MKQAVWVLRIGLALTFLGHGHFAWMRKPEWAHFLTTVGLSYEQALTLMPVIGGLDVLIALAVLIRPWKPVLIWAAVWAFATAAMRPLSGLHFMDFVERGANWAVPLALLFLLYSGTRKRA